MNNELTKGLTLFAITNSIAYTSNCLRKYTDNFILKETSAFFEVLSHGISYSFYADAYMDNFRHTIDGEIVARINQINPMNFYPAVPYIGEVLVDDILDVFNLDMSCNPLKYATPYIIGYGLKYLSQVALTSRIFKAWESFSHLPDNLPSPHIVGLTSAIAYNLINIPYIGKFLDNLSSGSLTSIDEWKNNPGEGTYIGEFYRDYILYAWEKIHKPHHFYEEIEAIDEFRAGGKSPLYVEYEAFWDEF